MLKNKRKILISLIIITLISIGLTIFALNQENEEVLEVLSKYGSRGDEVRQIQTKLKRWGYYNGNVDGIFGTQTLEAVKYFQRKNGLKLDGIAGPDTLKAMGIYNSSNSSSSSSSNSNNLNLLARVIYGEARGEPYTRTSSSRCGCYE